MTFNSDINKSGCQFKSSNKEKIFLLLLRILDPLPNLSLSSSLVSIFIPTHLTHNLLWMFSDLAIILLAYVNI